MPSVFFNWRPKLIRIGKKPAEQSVTIAPNQQVDVPPPDEPTTFLPSSTNTLTYINDHDYHHNQQIGLNEIDMYNSTPQMSRSVRFSEGMINQKLFS